MDDVELRELVPRVLSVLVRRGADFATAEDAVQEALIRAMTAWDDELPADPTGWLITVAWRAFLDMTRSEAARHDREVRFDTEPPAGSIPSADDTLRLYFLCAHPDLTSSSAVALTLRAVGGSPHARSRRHTSCPRPPWRSASAAPSAWSPGRCRPSRRRATVMRVLYLVFNEGYSGDIDLAAEAIRLTRQLAALVDDPEVHGLLALMLLHHARRRSRTRPDGSIVPLAEQDRSLWDTALIAEGIEIAHAALARDQLGEYQAQAAIAALHADAPRVEETDWVQIVEWYDELLRFADTPVVRLNRAVAVGEADGAPAGLAALAEVDEQVPRREAVAAYLHEKNGDLELAARLYADAARNAPNLAERDHQTRQAARLNQQPAPPLLTRARPVPLIPWNEPNFSGTGLGKRRVGGEAMRSIRFLMVFALLMAVPLGAAGMRHVRFQHPRPAGRADLLGRPGRDGLGPHVSPVPTPVLRSPRRSPGSSDPPDRRLCLRLSSDRARAVTVRNESF